MTESLIVYFIAFYFIVIGSLSTNIRSFEIIDSDSEQHDAQPSVESSSETVLKQVDVNSSDIEDAIDNTEITGDIPFTKRDLKLLIPEKPKAIENSENTFNKKLDIDLPKRAPSPKAVLEARKILGLKELTEKSKENSDDDLRTVKLDIEHPNPVIVEEKNKVEFIEIKEKDAKHPSSAPVHNSGPSDEDTSKRISQINILDDDSPHQKGVLDGLVSSSSNQNYSLNSPIFLFLDEELKKKRIQREQLDSSSWRDIYHSEERSAQKKNKFVRTRERILATPTVKTESGEAFSQEVNVPQTSVNSVAESPHTESVLGDAQDFDNPKDPKLKNDVGVEKVIVSNGKIERYIDFRGSYTDKEKKSKHNDDRIDSTPPTPTEALPGQISGHNTVPTATERMHPTDSNPVTPSNELQDVVSVMEAPPTDSHILVDGTQDGSKYQENFKSESGKDDTQNTGPDVSAGKQMNSESDEKTAASKVEINNKQELKLNILEDRLSHSMSSEVGHTESEGKVLDGSSPKSVETKSSDNSEEHSPSVKEESKRIQSEDSQRQNFGSKPDNKKELFDTKTDLIIESLSEMTDANLKIDSEKESITEKNTDSKIQSLEPNMDPKGKISVYISNNTDTELTELDSSTLPKVESDSTSSKVDSDSTSSKVDSDSTSSKVDPDTTSQEKATTDSIPSGKDSTPSISTESSVPTDAASKHEKGDSTTAEIPDSIPKKVDEDSSEKEVVGLGGDVLSGSSEAVSETSQAVLNETETSETADGEAKNATQDDIETYSQFAERVAMEKKNDAAEVTNGSGGQKVVSGTPSDTPKKVSKPAVGKKDLSKNYARWECGSKLLASNPEAVHAFYVLSSADDQYLLNNCGDKTWFVIELCDSIKPIRFELGNTELYSNLPKEVLFYGSQRYPTKDWSELGKFTAKDERAIQEFYIDTKDVFKYIKVQVLSHYGTEFFCPITQLKVYGVSELEVVDSLVDDVEEEEEAEQMVEEETKEEKKEERGMLPLVLRSMLTNVLGVLNRGASKSLSGSTATNPPSVNECMSLNPRFQIDEKKCSLAPTINWHLGCYNEEYKLILSLPIVRKTVQDRQFCKRLVENLCREKIDKEMREEGNVGSEHSKHFPAANQVDLDFACSKRACGNSYVCVMLCSHHLLALCHMEHYNTPAKNSSAKGTVACGNVHTVTKDTANRNANVVENKWNNGVNVDEMKVVEEKQVEDDVKVDKVEEPVKADAEDEERGQKVQSDGQVKETEAKEGEEKAGKEKKNGGGTKKVEGEEGNDGSPLPTVDRNLPLKETNGQAGPKESVVVRLTNKVKALEHNLSINSAYLEELSLRYKRQMEEMQRQFTSALNAIKNSSSSEEAPLSHDKKLEEREKDHRMEALQLQVEKLAQSVSTLASEQQGLSTRMIEQHLLLMLLEVLVLISTFYLCFRRQRRPQYSPPTEYPPNEPLPLRWHSSRGNSSNEGSPARRRHSDDSLPLIGDGPVRHVNVHRVNSFDENMHKKNKKRKTGGIVTNERLINGAKEFLKGVTVKKELQSLNDSKMELNDSKVESQTLKDSSAGVLFTSFDMVRKERLMKISECSEGSSPLHKDWSGKRIKEEPVEERLENGGGNKRNKQKSRSRDSSNHRTKKHKRNTSDGSITYENDAKKKQTGCGSKKLKRQNSNPGTRVLHYGSNSNPGTRAPHYGSIKQQGGWSPSEQR